MKSKLLVYLTIFALLVGMLPSAPPVIAQPVSAPRAVALPTDRVVASYSYRYYASGNISAVETTNSGGLDQTQTYTYDTANRLLAAQASQAGSVLPNQGDYALSNYQYDAAGRLVNGDDSNAFFYDNAGPKPYHAVDRASNGNVHYAYDAAGNLTTKLPNGEAGQAISYTYDAENRLIGAVRNDVTPAVASRLIYDADGQLILKQVGTKKTVYIGGYFEYTEDGASSSTQWYYSFGSRRVASQLNSNSLKYMFSDTLGSTMVMEDSNVSGGEIRDEARYKPFGELRYSLGSNGAGLATDLLYTGQRKVDEVGLYYYNARWVDVYLNHWTQPDTIIQDPYNSQDWDRYSFKE